jgi:hypothetical protein
MTPWLGVTFSKILDVNLPGPESFNAAADATRLTRAQRCVAATVRVGSCAVRRTLAAHPRLSPGGVTAGALFAGLPARLRKHVS